jgi:hypothetical protein
MPFRPARRGSIIGENGTVAPAVTEPELGISLVQQQTTCGYADSK